MNLIIGVLFSAYSYHVTLAEKPCAARQIPGRSVVCVCNETYCDQLERQPPAPGEYVTYTSSRGGLRFKKAVGSLQTFNNESSQCCHTIIELDPSTRFQKIEGFGGAVTDAAGINWKSLPDAVQKYLVDSYASDTGLEYNMLRVPIGGSDFSTHPYAYNELPVNDTHLSNFTLAPEDYTYKIPLIKALMSAATARIHLLGSTWSPAPWMKTNNKYIGESRLKREFFQTYADYHLKFIEKYAAADVPVWGITTTNEPINGLFNIKINAVGWSIEDMGEWIVNNLGPTIRNSSYNHVKIFTGDDQRFTVPFWFNVLLREHPKALEYLAGVAVHWYADRITPAAVLSTVTRTHPDKVILATEACEGSYPWQKSVALGSWTRAVSYICDIIEDLNHNVVGWIDWNICLDTNGGPNWVNNFVDSPVIVNASSKEFMKQPMYYALGHFTKFLPRDSQRIRLTVHKPLLSRTVKTTAFLTPRRTVVLIICNEGGARSVGVRCGSGQVTLKLEADSITTMEFLFDSQI